MSKTPAREDARPTNTTKAERNPKGTISQRGDSRSVAVDLTFVDETIATNGKSVDAVIPILQAMQEHYGYLPEEALKHVCERTAITPANITGVSSFYDMFRHKPAGRFIIRVCRGTACHVTGAERVEDALRRELAIPSGSDTDAGRQFTIEAVACLGCCTLAPVVRIGEQSFGHVGSGKVSRMIDDFLDKQNHANGKPETEREQAFVSHERNQIRIGLGSCCMAKGSDLLFQALEQSAKSSGRDIEVKRVGCVGMCHRTPLIEVGKAGGQRTRYSGLRPHDAHQLLANHFRARGLRRRLLNWWTRALDELLLDRDKSPLESHALSKAEESVSAFLGKQVHVATEHFGELDPLNLDEYVATGGFTALAACLQDAKLSPTQQKSGEPLNPEQIISIVERSGLRGRGGAGFPTGAKWKLARAQTSKIKYVICNGDEGDPGAFMDRMLLESFPFRIIEGLAVAAVAVGAHEGIFYVRHEYPLAVKRVRAAIKLLQKRGWTGENLLGSNYPLRLTIKEGGGAFVCGEETALIASIEGGRGMPRLRPPFPIEEGLWGRPTVINNVETLATIPWIIRNGPEAFARYGTKSSKGTKVFALAGNIQRGGLIEIPMGTTIREIVEQIGGGVGPGRKFKAVQIGGPSGGCVPARLADTPVDYESLREVGAIMGSGGLIVLDDTACMVDVARYFLHFTQSQSCGKCTFCRIGTRRMLDILERICAGKGQKQDLLELERLGAQVGAGSLCGLGKTAPNPVLTTLRYFRDEYEAHLQGKCPAGKCAALIKYRVKESCTGCTICAQHCPVDAIPLTPYQRHWIDTEKCTRCDSCRVMCPHDAIEIN